MRTLLICHEGAEIDRIGLARWLGSFSDLAGIIELREKGQRVWRRVRREIRRVGPIRFADVMAFRVHYKLFVAGRDHRWMENRLRELCAAYPEIPGDIPALVTSSPNTPEAVEFIKAQSPDIVIARCKTLIKEEAFSIPSLGTFVMHSGVCPEYRNAHGCFWALATGDLGNVGLTLLKIDKGVDTGPVFGYFSYPYDEVNESHLVIQYEVALRNLDNIRDKLLDIASGNAVPIDTTGRKSATWGHPWLTSYLKWKRVARQRSASER